MVESGSDGRGRHQHALTLLRPRCQRFAASYQSSRYFTEAPDSPKGVSISTFPFSLEITGAKAHGAGPPHEKYRRTVTRFVAICRSSISADTGGGNFPNETEEQFENTLALVANVADLLEYSLFAASGNTSGCVVKSSEQVKSDRLQHSIAGFLSKQVAITTLS